MTWMLVGSFALKVGSSYLGGQQKKKAEVIKRINGLQQEQSAYDRNSSENLAIGSANLTNAIRTGYKAGVMNIQMAQAKKRAIEQGTDLSKMAATSIGAANANAAAAGAIGPSVDAVVGDIDQKIGDARMQLGEDFTQQVDNFDTQLHDLLTGGQDAMRSARKYDVQATAQMDTSGTSFGDAVLGAAVDTAGSYFSQRMSLGLGSKTPSPAPGGTAPADGLWKQPALNPMSGGYTAEGRLIS